MTKKTIVIIIVVVILAVAAGAVYYCKYYYPDILPPDEPTFYFCGTGIFGGYIEAMEPGICEGEWHKIDIYKPTCQGLVKDTEHRWEEACAQAFVHPEAICLDNMEALGITLTEEEQKQCLKEVIFLTSTDFQQYIDGASDCEIRGGEWHMWSDWQSTEECDLPYPDGGKQCDDSSDCVSDKCMYLGEDAAQGVAATGECAPHISVGCATHYYYIEEGKVVMDMCIE